MLVEEQSQGSNEEPENLGKEQWGCKHVGTQNVPLGDHLTTLTACVCFANVDRYSTFLFSPSHSTFHSYGRSSAAMAFGKEGTWRLGPYPHIVVAASRS